MAISYTVNNGVSTFEISIEGSFVRALNSTADLDDSLNRRYVTDADLVDIGNLSGTNTGDQDLSGLVTKTTTVNSKALSSNISLDKTDIGLGNVQNVDATIASNITQDSTHRFATDVEKASWDAKQAALGYTPVPTSRTINGHTLAGNVTVTASDVGLGNVNNTSDLSKPISTATQYALDSKVDEVVGKGLSENDFTDADKSKLDGLVSGVDDHTLLSNIGTNTHAQIDTHIANTSNPHSVTKSQIGLGSVPNLDATVASNITQDSTHRFTTDAEKSTWNGKQDVLGYTPENTTNKSTDVVTDQLSNTKYPSVKAVFDWASSAFTTTSAVATQITTALSGYATQAWVGSQGFITNVVTSLGYTPENVANKQTDLTPSSTKYPTVDAVNTGLSGKVATSTTVNGHALSSNVTVTATDVGLSNVDNTSDVNKPVSSATQTALDLKIDENVAITGATKTKISYDSKGLVTSGSDATTADIPDSSNKRYVTDANLVVIGNTSNTNTGDNAVNSLYSGLVTNATHTGDATGSSALTVVALNGTNLAGLGTGLLKNTSGTGVPSIAVNSDLPVMSSTVGGAVPTPPNNTTTFLRGDGTFAVPPTGSGSSDSVIVPINFGASFTDKAQVVVTGEAWVGATSCIVPMVLTPSGVDPDEMYLLKVRPEISDIVNGVGFTVTLYSEAEAKGTYNVMCIGV